jgi:hypothetical protein
MPVHPTKDTNEHIHEHQTDDSFKVEHHAIIQQRI